MFSTVRFSSWASDFGGKARPLPRARLFRDARIVSSGWKDTLLCLRGHKHPPSDGWGSYLQEPSGWIPTDRPRRPGAKLERKGRRKKAFYLCQPMPPCSKGCQLLRIWCRYAGKYFILHVHSSERPLISKCLRINVGSSIWISFHEYSPMKSCKCRHPFIRKALRLVAYTDGHNIKEL